MFLIILSVFTLCFITWLSVSIRLCSNYCCLSWFVSSHLPSLCVFYIRRCSPPRSAVLPSSFLFLSPSLTHKRVLFIFLCNHIFCIPLPSLLCISACCTCQHWFFYTLSKLALSLFQLSVPQLSASYFSVFSLRRALSLSFCVSFIGRRLCEVGHLLCALTLSSRVASSALLTRAQVWPHLQLMPLALWGNPE